MLYLSPDTYAINPCIFTQSCNCKRGGGSGLIRMISSHNLPSNPVSCSMHCRPSLVPSFWELKQHKHICFIWSFLPCFFITHTRYTPEGVLWEAACVCMSCRYVLYHCLCVWVCMCVTLCVCACLCASMHAHVCAYTCACTHVCAHVNYNLLLCLW